MIKYFAAASALTLVACSPYAVTKSRTPKMNITGAARVGVATVCIFRSARLAQAVSFVVHDNGVVVGATRGRSHFCYEAEPGNHTIISSTHDAADTPARIDAHLAPMRYWLRQDTSSNIGALTSVLTWVDEAAATAAASGTPYTQLAEVRPGETIPPPIPFAPALSDAAR